jgi:hypothetical protein
MDISSDPARVESLRVVRAFLHNICIRCQAHRFSIWKIDILFSRLASSYLVLGAVGYVTPLRSVRQAPLPSAPWRRRGVPRPPVATCLSFPCALPNPPSVPLSRITSPRSQYFGAVVTTAPALCRRQMLTQRNTVPLMLPPLVWCSAGISVSQRPEAVPCGTMHPNVSLNWHMDKDWSHLETLGSTRPAFSISNFLLKIMKLFRILSQLMWGPRIVKRLATDIEMEGCDIR